MVNNVILLIGSLSYAGQGNVIKGFIPASRVQTYLRKMTSGTVYRLNKFFGSRNKAQYRVADHNVTVMFSWNTDLTPLQNSPVLFPEDRFRFHDHEEFEANCDLGGDLYGMPCLFHLYSTMRI